MIVGGCCKIMQQPLNPYTYASKNVGAAIGRPRAVDNRPYKNFERFPIEA